MNPTLITIKASHYCEKARWGLERAGIAYREEPHVPVLHRMRVRTFGGSTVPVLVDGETALLDSSEILAWADARADEAHTLYPTDPAQRDEVLTLEDLFDETLGPHVRRRAYHYLFARRDLVVPACVQGAPRRERLFFSLLLPPLRFLMRKAMNITPESVLRSEAKSDGVFDQVDALLADGRRYLVGDRFSAADLSLAALAAPAVIPPGYGAELPPLDALPQALVDQVHAIRERPVGQLVLRLYREERSSSPLKKSHQGAGD